MSETVLNKSPENSSRSAAEEQSGGRAPAPTAPPEAAEITLAGPRKLVRPKLPEGAGTRRETMRSVSSATTHSSNGSMAHPQHAAATSHAETLYLQKQVQLQTAMVVVLEDGEQLEGVIEWYDRQTIKMWLTNRQRVLVYKTAIKYMHKASEAKAKAEWV